MGNPNIRLVRLTETPLFTGPLNDEKYIKKINLMRCSVHLQYMLFVWAQTVLFGKIISELAHILKSKCKILYSDNLKNSRAGEVVGE